MDVTALGGALGFLTTIPLGRSERAWKAFAGQPAVMVLVGYLLGGLLTLPFLVDLPELIAGFGFVLGVGVFAGINTVDGLCDVADGAATHGDSSDARAAMKDSEVGVGAVFVLGLLLLGLFVAGVTIAGGSLWLVGVVVAAEVGAKLGMVVVVSRGTATHEGLGSSLSENGDWKTLFRGVGFSLPVVFVTYPHVAAAITLVTGATTGLVVEYWATARFGGINGDVLGATNELARLVGLFAGVTVWTLL